METFNLEKFDINKYYVTRDGSKVRLIFDKSVLDNSAEHPIVGYICTSEGWESETSEWRKNGRFRGHLDDPLDIVGGVGY